MRARNSRGWTAGWVTSLVAAGSLGLSGVASAASSETPSEDQHETVESDGSADSVLGSVPFALLADEGIAVDRGTVVHGGGIAVRSASTGRT